MNETPPEAGGPAGLRLAEALSRLQQHRRFQEQDAVLGSADMRLMWLLSDGTPRTQREIADTFGLEQSTVSRQVNAALAAGLLRRYREPGATSHVMEATPDGRDALARASRQMLDSYETALAALGDTDRQRLLDLFDRFVDTYGQTVHDTTAADPATGDR
ncbi:MarR family winged helix-turn-helix transcriptional regulator [Nocardia sp. BMG111209]|uniref:MarR family winged helix-turn-helix transcriptional regulator n=1 Tax=Nocardia sp. BMG111209 TaxID=1160137 RepID=UPI000371A5E7|nr:MarR family winged helix-turn-helix transcriptional regulator [Nocardia sp. BMG111209]